MTETAELSDYVLPARSPYESYDSSFFSWNYPEIYFQMRHPVVEPSSETKESGLILAEIADGAGIVPDLPNYPFILNAGRHTPQNANNLMRKPDWNKGRRTCTLAMNPVDAGKLGVVDGEFVKITTEAASERIELEVSEDVRPGQVLIPHGFGLKYDGVTYGIAVNRLTKNSHRDRLAATPIHRYVPCRVEKENPDRG